MNLEPGHVMGAWNPLAATASLTFADVGPGLVLWLQVCGAVATFGLAAWGINLLGQRGFEVRRLKLVGLDALRAITLLAALPCYAIAAWLSLVGAEGENTAAAEVLASLGGGFALVGVLAPLGGAVGRLRGRRIAAIARLSFQEAFRRRVLWVFLALLLVVLFGSWFLPHKPEDQVRTYVQVVFGAMTPLLLLVAGLLAAFGIPTDLQQQTIATLVTKPVERFEIVLGRFLGCLLLMTGVLIVMTLFSWVYVLREIDPEAAFQDLRARIPIYGELEFERQGRRDFQGVPSFLRAADYRRLIRGGPRSSHRAVWLFADLPADLARLDRVPCEFEFDITRTQTGGEEGKGLGITLSFRTWRWEPGREGEYRRERDRNPLDAAHLDALAEKYGIYEESRRIVNDRTYSVAVPGGLFRNALAEAAGQPPPASAGRGPLLQVYVKCEDEAQYLGVSRPDLYLLAAEGYFSLNFFKAAVGLWYRLCLVIGIAVACSTYLSGIVSWLTTMFLFAAGLMGDYLRDLAHGSGDVAGPGQSAIRLVTRLPSGLPLEQTPTTHAAAALDEGFRFFLRGFLHLVPDINRFDWTESVASGFDISPAGLVVAGIFLAGYLIPWAVLAYYLIKHREMAG